MKPGPPVDLLFLTNLTLYWGSFTPNSTTVSVPGSSGCKGPTILPSPFPLAAIFSRVLAIEIAFHGRMGHLLKTPGQRVSSFDTSSRLMWNRKFKFRFSPGKYPERGVRSCTTEIRAGFLEFPDGFVSGFDGERRNWCIKILEWSMLLLLFKFWMFLLLQAS